MQKRDYFYIFQYDELDNTSYFDYCYVYRLKNDKSCNDGYVFVPGVLSSIFEEECKRENIEAELVNNDYLDTDI